MLYDVVVIGAGVTGCAAAMELSRYAARVAVVEAEEDVCCGASKANSAIIHAGFDAAPGTQMAALNVEGSRLMPELCARLDVPYKQIGALVVSFDASDRPKLEALLERGKQNGVADLRIVEGEELRALEPNLSPAAAAALCAPTSGIVCPFELTIAMGENAAQNGAEFFFDWRVETIERTAQGWKLTAADGRVLEARAVVNAAGLCGAALNNMVSPNQYDMRPRKGEYCLLDKKAGQLVNHTIFQLPTAMGKGVLVTPTVHGNVMTGPTALEVEDPRGVNTTAAGLGEVLEKGRLSVPTLPGNRIITAFAGLRAHIAQEHKDFVIGQAEGAEGFFNAIGIESPGLSAAPAVGRKVAGLVGDCLGLAEKPSYDPGRPAVVRPNEMSFEERKALVDKEPLYGSIVCRCETVSEGEIVAAIRRPLGARSLDGVKRRTRAGMGRCQAGFCSPRVLEILSRELGVPQEQLTKCGGSSRPIVGKTREEAAE